ncbi:hypothetical protein MAIT1_00064 [Magnetofaba australis IT-1]|uniref:Helix-turn-helix domain-containing protein n=2 Tax=Magnetofaba TaxID=1472292 RepID=A0A1Y2K955_9PROT|nr:hypothetical protein MAIT1_00064 [Magnetofaba australis IT-1]
MELQEAEISVPMCHFTPVMTQERFCELSGVSRGVVEGWIKRGYLPAVTIGRRVMVNMVRLTRNCLDEG